MALPRRSSARGSRRGAGGIALIEPPELYHRVVAWPNPFDPPPTAPPIGSGSRDLGSRYDAPDASWLTLYTGAEREGAFGEKLAYFRTSQLEQKIGEFLEDDPDDPEPPAVAELSAEDVEDWTFGTAEANRELWLIDVMHPETHAACWPALEQLLTAFGHTRMDNGATLSPNRLLTRQIAGHLHKLGVATPTPHTTTERQPMGSTTPTAPDR